eukprot:TRINITY_DN6832_c0_g1_i2.p1 TRINITY_DN6832_c0_g1~~TRINITY_DN6832_c0_g1_i2.p1  ORF type:complete len:268 (+),score=42.97 TRINITY_DN6832_c0_g1_i2:785-1588(+)
MTGQVKRKVQVGFSTPSQGSPRTSKADVETENGEDDADNGTENEKNVETSSVTGWKLEEDQIAWLKSNFDNHDVDNSGALSHFEMMELWKVLFPFRSAEEIAAETDKIFSDIDTDNDDEISFDELFKYLSDDSTDNEVLPRPTKWRAWIWAVVGDYAGYYTIVWLSTLSKAMSLVTQTAILASIVNMMIESLPEYQNEDDEPGNIVTRAIEATCIYIFTFEFILRTLSYPGSNLKYMTLASTWVDIASILPFYLMKVCDFSFYCSED